ncbi:unnamed protein product [Clonostachys rosea]|uniref:Luciferase-like domain-containing protein n=1 Tax=Bionectria ochroleuca TaxID=29856 RepID=A0ABY6UCE0_BIOOC|nr:unnamed protein product [Clonostachys rosea]
MAEKKQLIINAFAMQVPGHLNPGLWKHPNDQQKNYKNLNHWIELAKKLEAAKFHGFFFADALGGYDVYKGPQNLDATLSSGAQLPMIDPSYAVPAMAAATESISFGVTASTTYESPYSLARRYSTLDHLTNGRIGWNIVTSFLDSAARNFGLTEQIEHDKRYDRADEFLQVTYKLWEGSWKEDAVVQSGGVFTDPSKVRQINHKGTYFEVPGPALTEPSPQRTPFLLQAGTSGAGKAFAAKHAEAVFVNAFHPEAIRPSSDSLRSQAKEFGRDPRDIKIIAGVFVVVAETVEAAQAKFAEYSKYGDREGALALFGGWSGFDLSSYSDDQDFRFVDQPAIRSMVTSWSESVPGYEGRKWDKAAIADTLILGSTSPKIIGDAKTVADELERWVEVADVDGFNFSYATLPGTFDDIIEFLLPELRKRGLFWEDYSAPGGTMRENYTFTSGAKRLPKNHTGAQYVWA